MTARTLPMCARHWGHVAGNCALCRAGGVFQPEASSLLRAIATHRRSGLHMASVNRADYERNERIASVRAAAIRVGKLRGVAKKGPAR